MLLRDLIDALPVTIARGEVADVRAADLTEDSRTVMPGSVFVARAGLKSDGRAYARDAVAAGATAILTEQGADLAAMPAGVPILVAADVRTATAVMAERLYGNPSRRLLLVGVTGTNGKSTVTHLVHQILNRCGLRCGMIGTVQIDDGTEIAPAAMTTPPSTEISRTLATMVDAGCEAAVMEVSSHALDQRRAAGLSFDAAVFTNFTQDHLDYHGTMENYLAAKRRLFEQMDAGPAAGAGGCPAVLNADDEAVASTPAGRRVLCSLRDLPEGGWRARREAGGLEGERLELVHGQTTIRARVPLVGAHNAMNTVQSVAVAWHLLDRAGVDAARRTKMVADALSLVHAPPGRLEPVHSPGDAVRVFVDYAHTDDALERVLATLRAQTPDGAALWCVFGCGGDRDRTKRPKMGRAAVRGADRAVLTSDNPRTESPSRIVADVLDGLDKAERETVAVHIDRGVAIRAAIAQAAPGDVVLIAGKGHETSQIVSDGAGGVTELPFDDREHARAALAERRERSDRRSFRGMPA